MTPRRMLPAVAMDAPVRCAWRTGDRPCRILPAGKYCQWHHHWLRLVEAGSVGDGQEAAFAAWWAQFQPTGIYAENHGPWWADLAMCWAAVIGLEDPPRLTDVLERELYIRRAEVRRYLSDLPMGETPWPRVSGLPLPRWEREEWQAQVEQLRIKEVV